MFSAVVWLLSKVQLQVDSASSFSLFPPPEELGCAGLRRLRRLRKGPRLTRGRACANHRAMLRYASAGYIAMWATIITVLRVKLRQKGCQGQICPVPPPKKKAKKEMNSSDKLPKWPNIERIPPKVVGESVWKHAKLVKCGRTSRSLTEIGKEV